MFRGEEAVFSYRKFVFIRGSPKKFFCSFAPTELTICCARAGTQVPVIFVSLCQVQANNYLPPPPPTPPAHPPPPCCC